MKFSCGKVGTILILMFDNIISYIQRLYEEYINYENIKNIILIVITLVIIRLIFRIIATNDKKYDGYYGYYKYCDCDYNECDEYYWCDDCDEYGKYYEYERDYFPLGRIIIIIGLILLIVKYYFS